MPDLKPGSPLTKLHVEWELHPPTREETRRAIRSWWHAYQARGVAEVLLDEAIAKRSAALGVLKGAHGGKPFQCEGRPVVVRLRAGKFELVDSPRARVVIRESTRAELQAFKGLRAANRVIVRRGIELERAKAREYRESANLVRARGAILLEYEGETYDPCWGPKGNVFFLRRQAIEHDMGE